MALWLRQSTASQEVQLGKFVDDTDFKTAETGLTIANTDIKLFKHGATTQANKNSGGATHIAAGYYYTVLDATDTNTLGLLEITVDVSGALPVKREFMVLPAMIYDSLILGTDRFDVNVTHVNDTAQTARDIGASVLLSSGTGTGQLSFTSGVVAANVTQFGGTNGAFSGGRPEVNTTHAAGTAWGSGAITAASIATDAITAAKIATDAGTEIATAVWALGTRTLTSLSGLTVDTVTTLTNLPVITANWLTAAGLAADAASEIAAAVTTAIGTGSAFTSLAPAATALSTATWTGTRANYLDNLSGGAVATASNLATVAGYLDTEIAAILEDTGMTLPTQIAALNNLSAAQVNAEVDTALTDYDGPTNAEMVARTLPTASYATATAVDDLPTNAELTTALAGADDAVLAQIALVKSKTDNLPVDPADQSAVEAAITAATSPLATAANLATIDTVVDGIKAKTDSLNFTIAGQVDSNVQYVNDTQVGGTGVSGDEWGPV